MDKKDSMIKNNKKKSIKKRRRQKKKITICFTILCYIILLIFLIFLGCVFVIHEKKQNQKIHDLQNKVVSIEKEIEEEIKEQIEESNQRNKVSYSDTAFNYFALGNSITVHSITSYWWNEIGMAATTQEKDYVHLISSFLEKEKGEICQYAFNFYVWEAQASDRAEAYELLDPYLDKKIDLVTIQLSENVVEFDTYERDYESLIQYIKTKAPNAQIIVIDDFWSTGRKSVLKKQAAKNAGVEFVSLSKIKGNEDYQCGMGTTVYDAEGNPHIVDFEGVAKHPNDKGMKYIADEVIKKIQ